jgi:hypothetical protein
MDNYIDKPETLDAAKTFSKRILCDFTMGKYRGTYDFNRLTGLSLIDGGFSCNNESSIPPLNTTQYDSMVKGLAEWDTSAECTCQMDNVQGKACHVLCPSYKGNICRARGTTHPAAGTGVRIDKWFGAQVFYKGEFVNMKQGCMWGLYDGPGRLVDHWSDGKADKGWLRDTFWKKSVKDERMQKNLKNRRLLTEPTKAAVVTPVKSKITSIKTKITAQDLKEARAMAVERVKAEYKKQNGRQPEPQMLDLIESSADEVEGAAEAEGAAMQTKAGDKSQTGWGSRRRRTFSAAQWRAIHERFAKKVRKIMERNYKHAQRVIRERKEKARESRSKRMYGVEATCRCWKEVGFHGDEYNCAIGCKGANWMQSGGNVCGGKYKFTDTEATDGIRKKWNLQKDPVMTSSPTYDAFKATYESAEHGGKRGGCFKTPVDAASTGKSQRELPGVNPMIGTCSPHGPWSGTHKLGPVKWGSVTRDEPDQDNGEVGFVSLKNQIFVNAKYAMAVPTVTGIMTKENRADKQIKPSDLASYRYSYTPPWFMSGLIVQQQDSVNRYDMSTFSFTRTGSSCFAGRDIDRDKASNVRWAVDRSKIYRARGSYSTRKYPFIREFFDKQFKTWIQTHNFPNMNERINWQKCPTDRRPGTSVLMNDDAKVVKKHYKYDFALPAISWVDKKKHPKLYQAMYTSRKKEPPTNSPKMQSTNCKADSPEVVVSDGSDSSNTTNATTVVPAVTLETNSPFKACRTKEDLRKQIKAMVMPLLGHKAPKSMLIQLESEHLDGNMDSQLTAEGVSASLESLRAAGLTHDADHVEYAILLQKDYETQSPYLGSSRVEPLALVQDVTRAPTRAEMAKEIRKL